MPACRSPRCLRRNSWLPQEAASCLRVAPSPAETGSLGVLASNGGTTLDREGGGVGGSACQLCGGARGRAYGVSFGALAVASGLDHQLVLDARVPAVGVGAVVLVLRAPFIVVVLSAALVAAGLRLLGWMA